MASREIIFEFVRVGNAVKVSAVDAATGIEVSVVGSAVTPEAALRQVAARKLDYVMGKKSPPRSDNSR